MLHIAGRHLIRQQRSFVSSVLLTRTWKNESVANLRKEAKERGLPLKGNKATLITRIQEYDQRRAVEAISSQSPPVPTGARSASTSSVTPGIPPTVQSAKTLPPGFMPVYLPDISQPDPEAPVQIPFLPDFWESHTHAQTYAHVEPTLPKLLVVAGASTHLDDGPSHNLHDSNSNTVTHVPLETSSLSTSLPQGQVGFWRDVADDVGIPVDFNVKAVQKAILDAIPVMGGPSQKSYSRPLSGEESNGLWVLFGLLAGTWIAGGFFNRQPEVEQTAKTDI